MRKLKSFGTYFFLTIVSLISVFPLYWMIAAATNNSTDVLAGKLTIGMNLIQNLSSLLERQNVGRAFGNSLLFSGILSILSLLVCSVAGYGFEIYHDKAAGNDGSLCGDADSVVQAVHGNAFTEHMDRLHIAYDIDAFPHYAVPPERTLVPGGDNRGGTNRRSG